MEKTINSYGEEYFHDYGDPLKISDIIKALQYIQQKHGDIYAAEWNDGILKTVKFVEIKTDTSGEITRAVLSV